MFSAPSHWQSRPSPNHNARPTGLAPTGIVLHADASSTVASSLDWCRRAESKVSYHVLIGRKGDIYTLVAPERRAWHAGTSRWGNTNNCNDFTIGVCLSNRNDGAEVYPLAQVVAAAEVCATLCQHFAIPSDRLISHAAIATPLGRKTDPLGLDIEAFQRLVARLMG